MQISKEEFLAWLASPVTEEVYKVLRERRDKLAHLVMRNVESLETLFVSRGRYEEMTDLLEMTWEDMQPEKPDV